MAVLFSVSILSSAFAAEVGYTVPGNNPVPSSITVDTTGMPGTDAVGLQVQPSSTVVSVTFPGNIDGTAASGESNAIGVDVQNGNAEIKINGNIDVTAGLGEATGLTAYLSPGRSADLTVNGDIDTEGSGATGIYTHLHEQTVETIHVDGNIASSGWEFADGVNIHMEADTRADVLMTGDIHSTSSEGYASGVEVYANFDRAESDAVFNGDITADGGPNATGIQLDSEGEDTRNTFTLNGDLTVSAENDVRAVQLQTDRGQLDMTVNGDLTAVGESMDDPESGADVSGLRVYSYDEIGQLSVRLHGDLTAEGTEDHSVTGVSVFNEAGDVSIDVEGNISSTGTAVAIEANSPYWDLLEGVTVSVVPDQYAPDADEDCLDAYYYYKEFLNLPDLPAGKGVDDVYRMYYNPGDHLWYMAEIGAGTSVITWKETNPKGEGSVDLSVHRDNGEDASVHGDEYGLFIGNNNAGLTGDVLIDGVLSGDQAGVCVSETAIADQMTLTVWKIETKEDHPIVATEGSSGTVTENQDFAEKIQYIIRTEQPVSGGSFTLDGTQQYRGYDVAHMNEVVTLKISVQDGYEIAGAWNGTDSPVPLQIGSDGNYYLTIPSGGGVYLSVTLQKKPDPVPQAPAGQAEAPASGAEQETAPESTGAEPAPVITVTVVPEAQWIEDPALQPDENGIYPLSEAVSFQPGATVEIAGLDQIMPEEIVSALNSLSVDEQITVLLSLLGMEEAAELPESMAAAAENMRAWFDALSPDERSSVLRWFRATVEYNGREMEGCVIELSIREADGTATRKRLSFAEINGAFLLVKVEVHV